MWGRVREIVFIYQAGRVGVRMCKASNIPVKDLGLYKKWGISYKGGPQWKLRTCHGWFCVSERWC